MPTSAPVLAESVQLIGEMEDSGFKQPPSLVRRADGQVIQLPPLLYAVAAAADGRHSYDDIATALSRAIHRDVEPDNVRFLVEEKLRPLGILAAADGSSPPVEKPDPFLGLRVRAAVVPERVSNGLGAAFSPLFRAPVVLAMLAAFVVFDAWLFFVHGVAQSLRQAIYHPGLFLPLFAAVVLAAAFHEIGHAAGCRFGGGRPGKMGCGLYLAWPAFYTDVTDAYRLSKRARLRTDLGGVYFNVVIIVATAGAYLLTRFEPLLLLIVVEHVEIVHQLLPVIRLDGYYIVADLTGVPDLFARIGPIVSSLLPWREPDERVTVLKRRVRIAVSAWVLIVVPALLFELLILLVHLPRLVATAWSSGVSQYHHAQRGFSSGDPIAGLTAAVQLVVLAIPVVGIGLMLVRTGRGGITAVWSRTAGRPVARSFAVAVMVACAALLVRAWVPAHNYKPIQRHERGTVLQGVAAIRHLPAGRQSLYVYDQSVQRGGPSTMTDAPSTTELPPATTTTVARTTETSLTRGGTTGTTAANLFDTETTVRRQSTTPTTTSDMSPSAGGDTTATTTP